MAEQTNPVRSSTELRNGLPLNTDASQTYTLRKKKTAAIYDAIGGPSRAFRGANPAEDGGPTKAGQYVIVGTWNHARKDSTWKFSRIEWGAPVRDDGKVIWVQINGKWRDQQEITECDRQLINEEVKDLYKRSINSSPALPMTSWILNDFGHVAGFMAEDINKNLKYDKESEKIHPQFFHTTPENELQTKAGKPVILKESHGCIHVKPADIDEMIKNGHMAKGTLVYIHAYDIRPFGSPVIEKAVAPYTINFFPGLKQIHVQGL